MPPDTDAVAQFIAGFVAAEGSFIVTGTGRTRFLFAVGLGAADGAACRYLRAFFGCGSVVEVARRKPHYDDECRFVIQRLRDHLEVTIPFMDEHLPVSFKREQYLAWRRQLLDYREHRAKRARPCSVEGCDRPRRAHGLCRRHLYAERGV